MLNLGLLKGKVKTSRVGEDGCHDICEVMRSGMFYLPNKFKLYNGFKLGAGDDKVIFKFQKRKLNYQDALLSLEAQRLVFVTQSSSAHNPMD